MDVIGKLRKLIDDRGWTTYHFSKVCGLPEATTGNVFRRGTVPTIGTLEIMCQGLGITLAQFFTDESENDLIEVTPDMKEIACKRAHSHGLFRGWDSVKMLAATLSMRTALIATALNLIRYILTISLPHVRLFRISSSDLKRLEQPRRQSSLKGSNLKSLMPTLKQWVRMAMRLM